MMPDYTSMGQLASRMGVSRPCVSKWVRRKDWPVGRDGPWSEDDARELDVWRTSLRPNRASAEYAGKRASEPPTDEQDKDYWLMRKYRAQALQQEGLLLDADAVMRAWTQTKAEERDQWLMLASAVQGLLTLDDDQTRQLDEFVRATLDGISDRMVYLAESAQALLGSSEGTEASETAEAERVGGEPSPDAPVNDGQPRPVEE